MQNNPDVASQSFVPHAQSLEFSAFPSVALQATSLALFEQWFNDDRQNLPSSASHMLVPHMQLAEFINAPS
jgi:hypothetical protein